MNYLIDSNGKVSFFFFFFFFFLILETSLSRKFFFSTWFDHSSKYFVIFLFLLCVQSWLVEVLSKVFFVVFVSQTSQNEAADSALVVFIEVNRYEMSLWRYLVTIVGRLHYQDY